MSNEVKLTFAGDATSLTKAADRAGSAVKDLGNDFDAADKEAGRFAGGVATMNSKIDSAESKFMGTADLVDGLAGAFGISLGPTVEYARAFGDMAGGFTATLGPAMEGITKKLGGMAWATKVQTIAQGALNAVMSANPIMLAVIAIAALTAGFIIAYKKVGWFHDGVDAMMDKVKDSAGFLKNLAEVITLPYTLAFRAIARLWNGSIGKLSFSVPGWVPGLGGKGFDVPDIPELANGGIANAGKMHLVGERGPELFIPGQSGRVVPNNAMGGGVVEVRFVGSPEDPFMNAIRKSVRANYGGSAQAAFGR